MTPPIYRARRKDNGDYVKGSFVHLTFNTISCFYIQAKHSERWEIDPSTLAISFEDMTDKNSKRIFAALNKSGVGGDYELFCEVKWVWRYSDGFIHSSRLDDIETITPFYEVETKKTAEVVGIYEGDHQ